MYYIINVQKCQKYVTKENTDWKILFIQAYTFINLPRKCDLSKRLFIWK